MARVAGVDLPREKRLEIALTYIYGVGKTRAEETIAATGISPDVRVKDLTDDQLVQLRDYIEGNFKVEGDLRRDLERDGRRAGLAECGGEADHVERAVLGGRRERGAGG